MAEKTYYEKLKDPRWQKLRLQAMEKADFCCEWCYDNESPLNVHHKEYFKGHEPWEYDVNQLSVLCESCHEELHEKFNLLKWIISIAPMDGPGNRTELAFLIGGYNNVDYDGILSISGMKHFPHFKTIYDLGVYARNNY